MNLPLDTFFDSATMMLLRVVASSLLLSSSAAFLPALRLQAVLKPDAALHAGKGFGAPPPPPPVPRQRPDPEEPTTVVASTPVPMNQGQAALAEMRREQAEKRDDELRKVREVRSVDTQLRENPGSAAIPEQVAMRMGQRMLPFVGIPLIGGMGAFVVFWYLATYKNQEFQPALVAFSTIGMLGVGLVGITYSVMSASWDPDREGSFLGTEEFSKNLDSLRGGLKRSRENTVIREKMAGMSEAEIDAAIRDLDRREEKKD